MNSALFPACIVLNNCMYCVTFGEHILERINMSTYEVEYICDSNKSVLRELTTVDLIKINGKYIYLFEYNGKRVIQVHIETKKTKVFQVCEEENGGYASAEFHNNKLYLFPKFINQIIIIDLNTEEIERKENIFQNIETKEKVNWLYKDVEFSKRICSKTYIKDDSIFIFSEISNIVAKYNITSGVIDNSKVLDLANGCISVQLQDDRCYLLDESGKLFLSDVYLNKLSLIIDTEKPYPYFMDFAVAKHLIWFLPCFGNEIMVYDINNITIYKDYPLDIKYIEAKSHSKFYGCCEDKENYYFAMHSANYMLIISKTSGKEKWVKPKESCKRYLQYHRDNVIQEGLMNMDEFIINVEHREESKRDATNIGRIIWKECV